MLTPDEEDQLIAEALDFAMDVHDDIAQAHRTVLTFDVVKLRQLCCALAAMVDPARPLHEVAWWRALAPGEAT